ncbi:YlaI family protein [Aciduricibacillus chroicocephali]|uniref:YlaI family protein n=1 Tax=Aciduricibacillus chroicocephali TaxID=3054939 RepID=A0ABY9KYA2_9BACI|nr:YlaI family protein [Bacillaceae bacterium 44XB]
MKATCILCNKIDDIDFDSLQAKNLRNRQERLHMCEECRERISKRTEERLATGNFRLFHHKKKKRQLIK